MNSNAKILIPNKEWLIKKGSIKIGGISKDKKGYSFYRKGICINFKSLLDINNVLDITLPESLLKKENESIVEQTAYTIYDYPCRSKPYEPVYDVKKKLPLFAKSDKSKSRYCAGYYVIKFRKGWAKSFCPKLITLNRYPFQGPFKTETEVKNLLNILNKQ